MTGKPLNHRGTFFANTNRSPKYKLSEILELLGVSQLDLMRLIRKKGGFPSPAISIGASHSSGQKSKKLYASKTYYDKKEVVDWYKKVTAEE